MPCTLLQQWILITIENLKHSKMLNPLGQAWQSGRTLAAWTPGLEAVNKHCLCGSLYHLECRALFDVCFVTLSYKLSFKVVFFFCFSKWLDIIFTKRHIFVCGWLLHMTVSDGCFTTCKKNWKNCYICISCSNYWSFSGVLRLNSYILPLLDMNYR